MFFTKLQYGQLIDLPFSKLFRRMVIRKPDLFFGFIAKFLQIEQLRGLDPLLASLAMELGTVSPDSRLCMLCSCDLTLCGRSAEIDSVSLPS